MLRRLRNIKAQAVSGEYVMTIFLVMAVMISMTIYFKRSVQGRIRDARSYMVEGAILMTRSKVDYNGTFYKEYEPYYANTSAIVQRDGDDTIMLQPGASSGIFRKDYNETISVTANSETLPPALVNILGF